MFRGSERGSAPYRIENHTLSTFQFRQSGKSVGMFSKNVPNPVTTLPPFHYCAYCWNEPLHPPTIIIEYSTENSDSGTKISIENSELGVFSFDENIFFSSISGNFFVKIEKKGPQKILKIFDESKNYPK